MKILGELHGRPGAAFHLLLHRLLVLPENLLPLARLDLAVLHIEQEVHLPRLERGADDGPAQELGDQPVEPVQHEFQLNQIFRRHIQLIGSWGEKV